MVKPSQQGPGQDSAARDWFLSAITCDGAVDHCLAAVLAELERRSAFIQALRGNLTQGAVASDCVTDMGQKIRALENTLRFRLPMLIAERQAAWFRAPAATSTGPFQSTLLGDPVFAAYDPNDAERVERGLAAAWTERRQEPLPFTDLSPCLWRTLLEYNARLERLACLPPPFAHLRLDVLPEGLPPELASRALAAFLFNVRTEILAARERLQVCHQQLLSSSEKLWALQKAQEQESRQRPRARPRAAEDLRAEFRRRRSGAQARQPLLSPADLEALQFMGFKQLPAAETLRQRYLAMAKQLHPDLQGGNDQAFKVLANAYAHLAARTG